MISAVLVEVNENVQPTAPVVLSELELDGYVSQMSVRGSLVYLADFFYGGLFVLDIADPARPTLEGTAPSRPFAQHLVVAGDHLLQPGRGTS